MQGPRTLSRVGVICLTMTLTAALALFPELGLCDDPFNSGATNLVTELTTIATPVAIILVMALGVAAASGRLSWGWPIGILIGICLLFSAKPLVTFIQGLFT